MIANAPALFQRMIDQSITGLPNFIASLDDILYLRNEMESSTWTPSMRPPRSWENSHSNALFVGVSSFMKKSPIWAMKSTSIAINSWTQTSENYSEPASSIKYEECQDIKREEQRLWQVFSEVFEKLRIKTDNCHKSIGTWQFKAFYYIQATDASNCGIGGVLIHQRPSRSANNLLKSYENIIESRKNLR